MTTQTAEGGNIAQPPAPEGATLATIDKSRRPLRLCAVSFKLCWQDATGKWISSGGFPLQMRAIGSLFDEMTLLVVRDEPRAGGIPLPEHAQVVPLQEPRGAKLRRKLSVLLKSPWYVSQIARHVRRCDAVHVPLPGDIPLLGMLVAMMLDKPLIARYGSSWEATSETTMMNQVTKWLMKRSAGGRNVMLATGDGRSAPAPGINWIFATALSSEELAGIHPVADRGLGAPPQLAYVGRLSPEKGVANLIRAVHRLKESSFQPLPHVTLIGDGPQRGELESLAASLRCGEQVQFAGQVDRSELSRLLTDSDFCVQPSLTEGFSKAWLDAMAHGLPVLASEVGAASAVIGDDGQRGWLVPPGDVAVLSSTLQSVLTDPTDWNELRKRCRDFAEQRTLEVWAARIGVACADRWNLCFDGSKLRNE